MSKKKHTGRKGSGAPDGAGDSSPSQPSEGDSSAGTGTGRGRGTGSLTATSTEAMSREDCDAQLHILQVELVKLQRHFIGCGDKILVLVEGRDAAGKEGSIKRIVEYLSPRETRVIALGKPSDRERGAWYFQRYAGEFDKVSSIGMFEHVGLANLPTYLATVQRVLRPGGLTPNHGITHDVEGWQKSVSTEFINRYVFPDGEFDCVNNIQLGMERAGFEIHDVGGLRPHYALTLRHWVERLEANRDSALREVGETTYRVWRLYMAACALDFEAGTTGVHQILASKPNRGEWPLPLSRADLYADRAHAMTQAH